MGDGQHGWATAEWLMLIRNMFVMDEKDALIIGCGILPEWLQRKKKLAYGPTLTPFGRVSVEINCRHTRPAVHLTADWYERRPDKIIVRLPGYKPSVMNEPDYYAIVEEEE
ncbi:MAG: hypothetical protein ACD_75C01565G0001 [uncultured bacterium]|nr:MAG: hypothetical protein ACD_75C01565G0001 [uncultured bacterium]